MVPLSMQLPLHSLPSPLPSLPPHSASWDHIPDKLLAPKCLPRGLKIENRCTDGSFKDTALPGCQAQSQKRPEPQQGDITLPGVARAPVGTF